MSYTCKDNEHAWVERYEYDFGDCASCWKCGISRREFNTIKAEVRFEKKMKVTQDSYVTSKSKED